MFFDKNMKGKETFQIGLNSYQFSLLKEEIRNLVISEFYPKIIKQELITRIELGSNVVLGDYAFCGNVNLETVILPKHINVVPDWAFCNCTSLKCVCLPESVSKIGKRAFSGCEKALVVLNPKNLFYIGDYAFADCTSLARITINSSAIVGRRVFSGWTASQTIYIHGDKKNLEKWADDWNDNCDAEIVYS